MSDTASFRRKPLVISGNSLSSGDRSTTFASGSPRALLRSYLIFVRDMRGQRREPSIELRSEDVTVLASHLGVTEEYVLGGLLDLMGATRAQRSTMMAMLAAGALTIVLTGSFVSDLSTDGVSVEMSRLADAVQAAAASSDAPADPSIEAATTAATERSVTVAESSPSPATAAASAATPDVGGAAESLRSASLAETARSAFSASVGRGAGTDAAAASAAQPGQAAGEPVSIGVAPDGSVVASVAPPVPAAAPDEPVATAELPDGTTVGVAAPPVPPPAPDEQVATAELPDGTTVGVAAPPEPPTPAD